MVGGFITNAIIGIIAMSHLVKFQNMEYTKSVSFLKRIDSIERQEAQEEGDKNDDIVGSGIMTQSNSDDDGDDGDDDEDTDKFISINETNIPW